MNTPIEIKSYSKIYLVNKKSRVKMWFWIFFALMLIFLFLPWTQNIKSKGTITTLLQENRPQQIQSPIAGRIVKWYVKEGDMVKKGDTILQLTEVKEAYLDPKLIERTQQQANAKRVSIDLYEGKASATQLQIQAINQGKDLKIAQLKNKLQQLTNKLKGEQAELTAATNDVNVSNDQLNRQQKMYDEGLVSQTQLQQRIVAYQNAIAKKTIVENKIAQTRQELLNNQVEQSAAIQEYMEKMQKAEGDRLASLSEANTSRADVAKLENQVSNYTLRNEMYIVTAPQDGQIVQAKRAGIGEILKESENITMVVPSQNNYAVEMYIRPVDFPLIAKGQKVRFLFDGFPAIVFSGWPQSSYGTFGGKIVAYESTTNDKGLFRILVAEDKNDRPWPPQLKIGTGAQGIVLLKNVRVWYEIWRNINGFPPDYYKETSKDLQNNEKK